MLSLFINDVNINNNDLYKSTITNKGRKNLKSYSTD
jgi:hypothetical protein